jgi:hypothetical protein
MFQSRNIIAKNLSDWPLFVNFFRFMNLWNSESHYFVFFHLLFALLTMKEVIIRRSQYSKCIDPLQKKCSKGVFYFQYKAFFLHQNYSSYLNSWKSTFWYWLFLLQQLIKIYWIRFILSLWTKKNYDINTLVQWLPTGVPWKGARGAANFWIC